MTINLNTVITSSNLELLNWVLIHGILFWLRPRLLFFRFRKMAQAGCSVGWSVVLTCQRWRFHSWSGHIRESTKECINKWNNKSVSLSQNKTPKKFRKIKWDLGLLLRKIQLKSQSILSHHLKEPNCHKSNAAFLIKNKNTIFVIEIDFCLGFFPKQKGFLEV